MLSVDLFNLVATVVNLLLLVVLMRIFLFKPVQKILAQRQEEADRQFAEAASKQEEADTLKRQYEQTLSDAEDEKKQVLAQARKDADEEYQRIVEHAKEEAKVLRESAVKEATQEKQQILKKAEQEIADMVVDAAGKINARQKGAEVDHALYDEFLNKAGEKV